MRLTFDVSGWTQEEKNYLQAAAYALLYQATGVDYKVSVKDGVVDVVNAPDNMAVILTGNKLKEYIGAEFAKMEIARLEALPEIQVREQELDTSQFKDIKLAKVDVAIDAVTNLAELKVLLKKFIRFVIART